MVTSLPRNPGPAVLEGESKKSARWRPSSDRRPLLSRAAEPPFLSLEQWRRSESLFFPSQVHSQHSESLRPPAKSTRSSHAHDSPRLGDSHSGCCCRYSLCHLWSLSSSSVPVLPVLSVYQTFSHPLSPFVTTPTPVITTPSIIHHPSQEDLDPSITSIHNPPLCPPRAQARAPSIVVAVAVAHRLLPTAHCPRSPPPWPAAAAAGLVFCAALLSRRLFCPSLLSPLPAARYSFSWLSPGPLPSSWPALLSWAVRNQPPLDQPANVEASARRVTDRHRLPCPCSLLILSPSSS
ncbi:hypothetical protein B0J11DRAFT_79792 [Dendryphion nanum]|uniref:Uncharacterized protein n=1 Tax=Dendryphion nanum TaxID=256645 RepID=A0A9P9IEK1_9PLEO|nr:hypothetical protein B0J11DRAFT_79792 [Dendryphion nanum]